MGASGESLHNSGGFQEFKQALHRHVGPQLSDVSCHREPEPDGFGCNEDVANDYIRRHGVRQFRWNAKGYWH